jgi:hypothetical protein
VKEAMCDAAGGHVGEAARLGASSACGAGVSAPHVIVALCESCILYSSAVRLFAAQLSRRSQDRETWQLWLRRLRRKLLGATKETRAG